MTNPYRPRLEELETLSEEALLDVRLCDLPLSIEGTWLEECLEALHQELEAKGLVFRPTCYLADEWLTPEGEPVIGIPFYLAHPVLTRLERKMMLEAEGETRAWCMQLLRHETGHALCYAYRLQRRKAWREVFGSSQEEYGETYRFRPYSKNFVRHLEGFYAQFHPDEDFVETFAVWLTPGLDWRQTYQGWKALKKLQYVDQLMNSIKAQPPAVSQGAKHWHIKNLNITLRTFYKRKQHIWAEEFPDFHDNNLKRIFFEAEEKAPNQLPAGQLVRQYRKGLVRDIANWSGERKYVVYDLVRTIEKRCAQLHLTVAGPEAAALSNLASYVTTLVMNYVYTGRYRGDVRKKKK